MSQFQENTHFIFALKFLRKNFIMLKRKSVTYSL